MLRLVLVYTMTALIAIVLVRILGLLVKYTIKVGPIIVGTIIGVLTIFLILSTVSAIFDVIGDYAMGPFETSILVLVGALLGMFAGYKLSRIVGILALSIVSGYTITRGLTIFVGHYPHESRLVLDLFNDEIKLDYYFLTYMFLMFVFTLISLRYQLSKAVKKSSHMP